MIRSCFSFVIMCALLVCGSSVAVAQSSTSTSTDASWISELGAIPVQHDGRIMPLETYARQIASAVTGRTRWSADRGPAGFAGKDAIELWCDIMFDPDRVASTPLIAIEDRGLKSMLGFDVEQRFFSGTELAGSAGLGALLAEVRLLEDSNPGALTREHRAAVEAGTALSRLSKVIDERSVRLVPHEELDAWQSFAMTSMNGHGAATEHEVTAALRALQATYLDGGDMITAVASLRVAIDSSGPALEVDAARRVRLELWYNAHRPWIMSAMGYGLALILFGCGALWQRRLWFVLAGCAMTFGMVEHVAGVIVRSIVLERPPVSNTYESLLWMGLVAIVIGVIAQFVSRGGWYLVMGVVAALLSVLFSMLVPLAEQSQSLPPVLRSNFWLIVHVLVIVASYGVLTLCAVLGHAFLVRDVILRKGNGRPLGSPLITQVYRTMQLGVLLLTAGTILGGVWAAESWGRFWGWDPKETWALVSIIVYFAMLHARYVGWIRDPGLAIGSIVGFGVIVWTFYGVNYVMASGLHSYGFGSGGVGWLIAAAAAELGFIGLCVLRLRGRREHAPDPGPNARRDGLKIAHAAPVA